MKKKKTVIKDDFAIRRNVKLEIGYKHLTPEGKKLFDVIQDHKLQTKSMGEMSLILDGMTVGFIAATGEPVVGIVPGAAGISAKGKVIENLKLSKKTTEKLGKVLKEKGPIGIINKKSMKKDTHALLKRDLEEMMKTPRIKIKAKGKLSEKGDTRRFILKHEKHYEHPFKF